MDKVQLEQLLESNPELRVEAALGNSKYFSKRYLGLHQPEHTTIWHNLIDSEPERLIRLAPRAHLKSTTFTYVAPIYELYKDFNIRIIIVSKTMDQSEKFLGAIKQEIEGNERLCLDFGDLKPEKAGETGGHLSKWTNQQLFIKRPKIPGMPTLKDPTIRALGVGGAITGGRADLIICDDILDDENTKSATRREDTENWFFGTLQQLLVPRGKLWVVGTRKHEDDLYGKLLEHPGWNKGVDKAIVKAPAHIWDIGWDSKEIVRDSTLGTYEIILDPKDKEEIEVLWPSEWPIEKLLSDRLDVGATLFDREKQNQPAPTNGALPASWLHLFDIADMPTEGFILYGCDLAISEKEKADEFALAKLFIDRERQMWLFDVVHGHFRFLDQSRCIAHHSIYHPPLKIWIESQQYQAALAQYMEDTTTLPIEPIIQHGDKYMRLTTTASQFSNGRVKVARHLIDFQRQWEQFPFGKRDDLLDAAQIVVAGAISMFGSAPIAISTSQKGLKP